MPSEGKTVCAQVSWLFFNPFLGVLCLLWQINHTLFWRNGFCFIAHCCCPQTPEGKFLRVPSPAGPPEEHGSSPVQCSAVWRPAREGVRFHILPKGNRDANVMKSGEPTTLEKVAGSNLFLHFSEWSVLQPGTCLACPKCNSKSGEMAWSKVTDQDGWPSAFGS